MSPLSVLLPTAVMMKDLRLRMRGWRWAGVISFYAGILAAIALIFLLQKYSLAAGQATRAGIDLFQTLSFGQLFLIVFVTPASMAGAISGERQHHTWDLLVISRASAWEIVWGKYLAGIAFNLMLIVASLPLFALVFLFGGITLSDAIPAFMVFVCTVLLLGASSLAVSALTARLTVSYMVSMLVALLLAVGLSLVALYLQAPGQISLVTIGSIPFQSINPPSPLTPLAQLDPLIALLSALPSDAGGTVLGGLGSIDHAFGLPWQLPWWGAYALLCVTIAPVLILTTVRLVRSPLHTFSRVALPLPTVGEGP